MTKKKKRQIDYYTLALLKENFPFLLLIVANLLVLIFLKNYYFNTYKKNLNFFKDLQQEVMVMKKSQQAIASFSVDKDKIDKYYQVVNVLLPDKENIFTIISALENLSNITGFYITNYSLQMPEIKGQKGNSLEVVVSGLGNSQAFMRLLEEYNFASGRLITMDSLTFSTSNQSAIKLVFKFYTRKSPKISDFTKIALPDKEQLEWIEEILPKIRIESIVPVNSEDILYRTKPNPFE